MKIKSSKKIIAFLLCFVITFFSICVPAKADSWFRDRVDDYRALKEITQWTLYDVFDMLHLGTFGLIPEPSQAVKDKFGSYYDDQVAAANNVTTQNVTNEMRLEFLDNNITINNDDSVTFGSGLNLAVQNWQNDIQTTSPSFYVYSFNLIDGLNNVQDGNYYNLLRRFLIDNQDEYMCFLDRGVQTSPTQYSNAKFYLVPKDADHVFVMGNDYHNMNFYYVDNYDYQSWEEITNFITYEFDQNSFEFVKINDYSGNLNPIAQADPEVRTSMGGPIGWLTVGRYDVNICFRTLNDLKYSTQGQAPYYVNESVYNDYSSSSGDYTFGSNNSNQTTYNDIINWNIQYEREHGTWPTPDEIQQHIVNPSGGSGGSGGSQGSGGSGGAGGSATSSATANNEGINITINNNHSLNIGGSSLSGNTVSGNGTDGSGSVSNIFDWLGNLGNIIGNFIRNVGEMIVNALEGIGEAITTIMEGIPNILSPLIEFVFGGLPEELQALITLGITCAIFVGVIKAIKK